MEILLEFGWQQLVAPLRSAHRPGPTLLHVPALAQRTAGAAVALLTRPVEESAQLDLCTLERTPPRRAQAMPAAVDVKVEHRHGRAERRGFTPLARERRTLERGRDSPRRVLAEDALLEIERVAGAHDTCGPPRPSHALRGFRASAAAAGSRSRDLGTARHDRFDCGLLQMFRLGRRGATRAPGRAVSPAARAHRASAAALQDRGRRGMLRRSAARSRHNRHSATLR